MPKFNNADGTLTDYSLSLGYIQTDEYHPEGPSSTLYRASLAKEAEYKVWVSVLRNKDFESMGNVVEESFTSLTEARKFLKFIKKFLTSNPPVVYCYSLSGNNAAYYNPAFGETKYLEY